MRPEKSGLELALNGFGDPLVANYDKASREVGVVPDETLAEIKDVYLFLPSLADMRFPSRDRSSRKRSPTPMRITVPSGRSYDDKRRFSSLEGPRH
jgi:hypothetical protein